MENRTLTILFTDMKGFTSRTSQQSRSENLDLIRSHKELMLPGIQARGGRLIKGIGDAFLCTFESPTDAVLAGMELQETMKRHNAAVPPDRRVEIRVAINTGEVTLDEGDVYGEPVNIAARIEGIAEANEIFFTEATYLSMNKSEVPSAEIGYRLLKGIPEKIRVYKVIREGGVKGTARRPDPESATGPLPPATACAPHVRRMAAFAIDVALVAALAAAVTVLSRRPAVREVSGGVFMTLFLAYTAVAHGWKGKTLGKKLMGLRIVRTNGTRVGWIRSLVRSGLYVLSMLPPPTLLGFWWALFDRRRQAWHDKIAETMVVQDGAPSTYP